MKTQDQSSSQDELNSIHHLAYTREEMGLGFCYGMVFLFRIVLHNLPLLSYINLVKNTSKLYFKKKFINLIVSLLYRKMLGFWKEICTDCT